jgi:hypothetical protein
MAAFNTHTSIRRLLNDPRTALISAITMLLLYATGCGGAGSASIMPAPQSQTPGPQPAETSSTSSSGSSDPSMPASGSGSQSSSSGTQSGSPSNNNNNSSIQAQLPVNAVTTEAIQTLPDWQWCTAKLEGKPCASGLGNATSTLTQDQQTPSLSGQSSMFTLGGQTAYSNALWWKSFGPNSTPTNFVYDVYFYLTDPNLPEALEFDTNQSFNDVRYTWGTECSYRNTGHWDIWNPESEKWETTSVPCPVVSANTWHHLTWQVERVNGQVHYISVTLDGDVSTVDKYYNPQPHYSGSDLNVAFQMDGDYRQDPYSVWLDNFTLSYW